jgi:hypothetical protein
MGRPQSFKHAFVALRSIPYTEGEGLPSPAPCGGVIGKGQMVWASHLHQWNPSEAKAFLESVGVVSLDPRWLVPADLYQGLEH